MPDKPIRPIGLSDFFVMLYAENIRGGTAMEDKRNIDNSYQIPIWHKATLLIEEAMAYTGVDWDKLREMTNREDCPFILWNGSRRLIKRKEFDEYISKANLI